MVSRLERSANAERLINAARRFATDHLVTALAHRQHDRGAGSAARDPRISDLQGREFAEPGLLYTYSGTRGEKGGGMANAIAAPAWSWAWRA